MADRQRAVLICDRVQLGRDELVARHAAHGLHDLGRELRAAGLIAGLGDGRLDRREHVPPRLCEAIVVRERGARCEEKANGDCERAHRD